MNDGAPSADDDGRPVEDPHSRLVRHPLGRVVAAAILLVGGFWVLAPNMPGSAVRDEVDGLFEPAIAMGLVQDWSVFSPNPRDQSIDVRARLRYDDGTIGFWDVPEFDPLVGAFRSYRWRKWQERIRLDDRDVLWEPTAEWIARENLRDGDAPVRITLIRRWIDHAPLLDGQAPVDSGWNEFEFYTWDRDR